MTLALFLALALAQTPAAEAPPEYTRADSLLFQFWVVLFLLVICFALFTYLRTYLPR